MAFDLYKTYLKSSDYSSPVKGPRLQKTCEKSIKILSPENLGYSRHRIYFRGFLYGRPSKS